MIATLILLALIVYNLGINIVKNGKPKDGEYNYVSAFVATIITLVLYYYAGMFDNFFN